MKKILLLAIIFTNFLSGFSQPLDYSHERNIIKEIVKNSSSEQVLDFNINHLLAIRLQNDVADAVVFFDNASLIVLRHLKSNNKHFIYYHFNAGRLLTARMIYFELNGEKIENLIITTPNIVNITPGRMLFKKLIRKEIFTIDYTDRAYLDNIPYY